jgi:hypothetical protein
VATEGGGLPTSQDDTQQRFMEKASPSSLTTNDDEYHTPGDLASVVVCRASADICADGGHTRRPARHPSAGSGAAAVELEENGQHDDCDGNEVEHEVRAALGARAAAAHTQRCRYVSRPAG